MKRTLISILCLSLMLGLGGCGKQSRETQAEKTTETQSVSDNNNTASQTTDYPNKTINGSIVWAAGGACDNTVRALSPHAQEALGQTVILTNRAGASNAIAVKYVYDQPADGYNILFGAESIQMGKVMGTTELDYDDFIPINIFCQGVGVVLVRPDSYDTMEALVSDLLARPKEVKMGITGPSGTSIMVDAMLTQLLGTQSNQITFDGE